MTSEMKLCPHCVTLVNFKKKICPACHKHMFDDDMEGDLEEKIRQKRLNETKHKEKNQRRKDRIIKKNKRKNARRQLFLPISSFFKILRIFLVPISTFFAIFIMINEEVHPIYMLISSILSMIYFIRLILD